MNIKELDIKREKVLKELASKEQGMKSYAEAAQRILTDIHEEKEALRLDLIKRISIHFKGIKPDIRVDEYSIKIEFEDTFIFEYLYNDWAFEHITKKMANNITAEYKEVYGEPKERGNGRYQNDDAADAFAYSFVGIDFANNRKTFIK